MITAAVSSTSLKKKFADYNMLEQFKTKKKKNYPRLVSLFKISIQ